ncbi:hypothetical protein [Chitinimonas sp.]|uniref:hypothetical protein n=1 Tax=Chitinimonas sp. TaxID=1934313 RepID=UPI0035AE46ED
MSENELVYASAAPAPQLAAKRSHRWLGWAALAVLVFTLLGAIAFAQTGHVVIDGVPVRGFAGIGVGFAAILAAMLAVLVAVALAVAAMVGVSLLILLLIAAVLLLVVVAVSPVLLPFVLAGVFVVWLFRRK